MKFFADLKKIGSRLKETRLAIRHTQEHMAKLCSIQTSSISEMEAGIRGLHPAYLVLLAKEFNVNLNWIFIGSGPMFNPDFEIKWDFGLDTRLVLELVYLLEHSPEIRYGILGHFLGLKNSQKGLVETYLQEKRENGNSVD